MAQNNGYPSNVVRLAQEVQALGDDEKRKLFPLLINVESIPQAQAAAEEPQSDPWQAYTLADAYQERPPLEHVAGRMFQLPSLSIVYGAPGTLKSFLLQDLAACVASGQVWLEPARWQKGNTGQGFPTKQAPVMWVDFDNGARRTHNRFESLGRARNLPINTPITYYSMPAPWLAATNPESIGSLATRIKATGTRLVIIDNLGNVSGDADENSAEMGSVMARFRQVAEETGAAIILVHHQRKSNGTTGRAGDTLRGHSSIEAALDLALLVEREDQSDTITIRATKVRGADVLPFSAVFTFEDKPGSDELLTARFYGVEAEDDKSNAAIERAIIEVLTNSGSMNKTKLKAEVKEILPQVGPNRVGDIANRMADQGRIKVKDGMVTNEKVFYL